MADNVRNPLGPLFDKIEDFATIGQDMAKSAVDFGVRGIEGAVEVGGRALDNVVEFGGNAIDSATELGKRATRLATKPVDIATDAFEGGLGLSATAVKKLGNIASGLLPALGDRSSKPSDKE